MYCTGHYGRSDIAERSGHRIWFCDQASWRLEPSRRIVPRRFSSADRPAGELSRLSRPRFLLTEMRTPGVPEVAVQANQTLYIAGWTSTRRWTSCVDMEETPQLPAKLGEFWPRFAAARRLKIYVLNWDFAMIYALSVNGCRRRKPDGMTIAGYRIGWTASIRSASHHQKDRRRRRYDGIRRRVDLTKSRWDTSAHAAQDPRRVDADGQAYPPFHDVQMMVAGQAASAPETRPSPLAGCDAGAVCQFRLAVPLRISGPGRLSQICNNAPWVDANPARFCRAGGGPRD